MTKEQMLEEMKFYEAHDIDWRDMPHLSSVEWLMAFFGKYGCNQSREMKLSFYKQLKNSGLDSRLAWKRATYEFGRADYEHRAAY
jgi:hypothetical protein